VYKHFDAADDPALLTADAARYAGLHPKTLLRLARRRQIAFIQMAPGGPIRFRRSALNAFLESRTTRERKGSRSET